MNKQAFTLVEIIVVAIIVGLLGLMAIPNLTRMMNRSYAQDAMHNLIAIYAAQQNYAQNNGGGNTYLACADYNAINTGLGLSIASSGGLDYSCETVSNTCSATAAPGSQAGNFTMQVTLVNPITVTTTPAYCSGNSNPCCTAGGGAAGTSCP